MTSPTSPTGISRRTMAHGAAWAIPAIVVAGAAPALASSQCEEHTTSWSNPNADKGRVTSPDGATMTAVAQGNTYQRTGNMCIKIVNKGLYNTAVYLWQTKDNSKGQLVTITLPENTTCAKFYIGDIDSGKDLGIYRDFIEFITPGVTITPVGQNTEDLVVNGQTVQQSGSITPNAKTSDYAIDNSTDLRGTIQCTYTGTSRTIQFIYKNSLTPTNTDNVNANSMQLLISDVTYKTGTNCSC